MTFNVPAEYDGRSLNEFLRRHCGLSGTTIKRARHTEMGLTADGEHIRTVDPVRAGAVIRVAMDSVSRCYRPSGETLCLLYADSDVAVFDKPAGMPCHPSRGHPFDSLANAFASAERFRGIPFRPVGRLDKDTSGPVVCALNPHAAYFLNQNRPEKLYLAIVSPPPEQPEGTIEAAIARESADSVRRCVSPAGQSAVTGYKTLLSDGKTALIALKIATGRTHQIRVHMSHIGSPLKGDALYGGDCTAIKRHALHCAAVSFTGVLSGERISVFSPLLPDMRGLLAESFGKEAVDAVINNTAAFL